MVSTEIRVIIFFAAKDGETLYSQQKQDLELTMAQIILIAKFRPKLKKVGKTTRDQIQISKIGWWFLYHLATWEAQ